MSIGSPGSLERPDRVQRLLLKAALLQGDPALRAWTELGEARDFRRLDPASLRLLPLVYRNLRTVDSGTSLESIQCFYRDSWTRNRLIFEQLTGLLRTFEAARIDTLLLKGAALVQVAYKDYGARPMFDVDVLVPLRRAMDAIDLLEAHGWRSTGGFARRLIGVRHADEFANGGYRCDLHWSVLQECNRLGETDDFWSARREVSVGGVVTHVLCPADQLLHTCVHGMRSGGVQTVTWIADAMTLLRNSGADLDWERIVDQATTRRIVVPIRQALRYLRSEFSANIPDSVIDRFDRARTSRGERIEYRVKVAERRLVGTLPVLWLDYCRWADGRIVSKLAGFPRYLQITFRRRTLGGLPRAIFELAVMRIRRAFAGN